MLYGIACGTRGWVYISSHGVGYDIPSLSARHCVAFGRSMSNPSVVNDDSCGVHSRPYHSCVIACVMQAREEHAMGHDSGGTKSLTD